MDQQISQDRVTDLKTQNFCYPGTGKTKFPAFLRNQYSEPLSSIRMPINTIILMIEWELLRINMVFFVYIDIKLFVNCIYVASGNAIGMLMLPLIF